MDPVFVYERVFVTADQREHVERVVECPDKGAIPFSRCERCPHFFETSQDERFGGQIVDCAHAPAATASAVPRHVDRGGTPCDVVTSVGEIMTRAFVALEPRVPVDLARRYLVEEQIGCLLVLDEHRSPIGIVTLRDLVEKRTSDTTTAGDIASSPVITAPATMPVARAAAIMSFEGVHHLAVVDADGAASGVLSSLDVLRWLGHRAGMLIPRATARQRASSYATGPRSER
ncbi:MAG: CBS domain-containing protein [Polyangiaceae bacterium]